VDSLQSVLKAAEGLVFNARKYDRISPLLLDLHWLRVPEHIKFRLAALCCTVNNSKQESTCLPRKRRVDEL